MYLDDYEKITKNNVTTEYYFLENDVIVTKKTGTSGSSSIKLYQAVTDNLGSILAVYGEINNLVFKAKYDVWGKQTVYKNALGLYRGYTGHEMLPGFELINMGGRMYDPVVARFLSCDNFVQEPTNSQNFNRYSYCLNNPLKYTDPSGNAFVIDDVAIAFMAYSLASSMMTAAATGQNVWRAAGINILSQGATLGIGAAFGNCGGVGYEILRAGAHGFTSGVVSSLQGGSFGVGFASGAFSSAAGSAAQALKLGEGGMLVSSVLIGGTSAYISGGDFLQGVLNGLQVGLLNHRQHDSGDGDHNGGLTAEEIERIYAEYKDQSDKYKTNEQYYRDYCGGKIANDIKERPQDYENSCAARLSGAMNASGVIKIPYLGKYPGTNYDITHPGANGQYYFMKASDMRDWLVQQFGCEPVQIPFGTLIPYPALIFQTGWSNASGHIDVSGSWFGIGTGGHADQYFYSGKHPTYVWYSK